MGFSGDIAAMGQLADRIADLAEVPSRAAPRAARTIAGLIEEEFADGSDPYGDPWEPLADATIAKGRKPPPLTETFEMRRSVDVRPMAGAGISVTVGAPYASPHQTGWEGPQGSGPARPILPDRAELPEEWEEAIESAMDREVRR